MHFVAPHSGPNEDSNPSDSDTNCAPTVTQFRGSRLQHGLCYHLHRPSPRSQSPARLGTFRGRFGPGDCGLPGVRRHFGKWAHFGGRGGAHPGVRHQFGAPEYGQKAVGSPPLVSEAESGSPPIGAHSGPFLAEATAPKIAPPVGTEEGGRGLKIPLLAWGLKIPLSAGLEGLKIPPPA